MVSAADIVAEGGGGGGGVARCGAWKHDMGAVYGLEGVEERS